MKGIAKKIRNTTILFSILCKFVVNGGFVCLACGVTCCLGLAILFPWYYVNSNDGGNSQEHYYTWIGFYGPEGLSPYGKDPEGVRDDDALSELVEHSSYLETYYYVSLFILLFSYFCCAVPLMLCCGLVALLPADVCHLLFYTKKRQGLVTDTLRWTAGLLQGIRSLGICSACIGCVCTFVWLTIVWGIFFDHEQMYENYWNYCIPIRNSNGGKGPCSSWTGIDERKNAVHYWGPFVGWAFGSFTLLLLVFCMLPCGAIMCCLNTWSSVWTNCLECILFSGKKYHVHDSEHRLEGSDKSCGSWSESSSSLSYTTSTSDEELHK